MLDDRPEMRGAVPPTHPVVAWLAAGFNGDRIGERVYWDGNSPRSGRPAEHGAAFESYAPYISISGGTESTAVDKWTSAVFEMYNLENSAEFDALARKAIDSSMDADEYANQCVELEFNALKSTCDFFEKHPLPGANRDRDKLYVWVTSELGTFEEYKATFDGPGKNSTNSNFEYFKEYYNETLVPYIASRPLPVDGCACYRAEG
jgi:hypothetical protein